RLQPPAGPHPVQIPINIQLQQIARRVRRSSHLLRHSLGKSKALQIQPRHKGVNHPNRIVAPNHLVQNLGKQRRLVSRLSRHVRHHDLESKPDPHDNSRSGFHTAWNAGTHNHRPSWLYRAVAPASFNNPQRWLWVPGQARDDADRIAPPTTSPPPPRPSPTAPD